MHRVQPEGEFLLPGELPEFHKELPRHPCFSDVVIKCGLAEMLVTVPCGIALINAKKIRRFGKQIRERSGPAHMLHFRLRQGVDYFANVGTGFWFFLHLPLPFLIFFSLVLPS